MEFLFSLIPFTFGFWLASSFIGVFSGVLYVLTDLLGWAAGVWEFYAGSSECINDYDDNVCKGV